MRTQAPTSKKLEISSQQLLSLQL